MESNSPPIRTEVLQALQEVLNQLHEIFVVCDANDVILFANDRLRAFSAAVEPWTRPGNTYGGFLRACAAHGLVPLGERNVEQFIADALRRRREGPWPVEFEFANGLWLLINHSRMANGYSVTYATDITERKRMELALRQQSERLLIGQRTAGMVVMEWNIRKDELTWSDDVTWLRGPLPASGKYPFYKDQVHPEDRPKFLEVRTRGIETMERHDQEYRLVRTDGVVLWVRSERVVIPGPDGKAERMLLALHNITRRKETEQALQTMNDELERRVEERTAALAAANRDLESFSYSVSHDMRAPLRAIAGFVNLLREQDGAVLSEEGKRHLRVVEDNALRMGVLIDALLELAHATRRAMVREPVDMRAIVDAVCATLAADYPRTRFELEALPPALGDATLIRQVFFNLVSNALKYSSRAAAPCVRVEAYAAPGENVYVVRDNGIGFDMAHTGKLFEPFYRLHAGDGYGGNGIGLALASQIVRRHQGRIWAEAVPGQGAAFFFTLGALGDTARG